MLYVSNSLVRYSFDLFGFISSLLVSAGVVDDGDRDTATEVQIYFVHSQNFTMLIILAVFVSIVVGMKKPPG